MERIISRENPKIKRLSKLLTEKKERVALGLFVTEGVRLSGEAAGAGIEVQELFITKRALEHYPEQTAPLLTSAAAAYELSPELSQRLGDTKTPQGVFCVCRMPKPRLSVEHLAPGRYLALESLQDPGNIGTILRTADAFALSGVILTADCPDVFSPKVLRSTMGSAFRVAIGTTRDLPTLLRQTGRVFQTYAATLGEGARSIRECALSGPCIVAVGNEGNGLSAEAAAACGEKLFIDMPGYTESLNAAVAASVIMWEMVRGTAQACR